MHKHKGIIMYVQSQAQDDHHYGRPCQRDGYESAPASRTSWVSRAYYVWAALRPPCSPYIEEATATHIIIRSATGYNTHCLNGRTSRSKCSTRHPDTLLCELMSEWFTRTCHTSPDAPGIVSGSAGHATHHQTHQES